MSTAVYTAEALSRGSGRQGAVRTSDGRLDVQLAPPKELGGSGEGSNPEQLFAAGFSACFHSAVQLAARNERIQLTDSTVGARVSLNREGSGLVLGVLLEVDLPGVDADTARRLVQFAEEVCPYSRATRGNIRVEVTLADD